MIILRKLAELTPMSRFFLSEKLIEDYLINSRKMLISTPFIYEHL